MTQDQYDQAVASAASRLADLNRYFNTEVVGRPIAEVEGDYRIMIRAKGKAGDFKESLARIIAAVRGDTPAWDTSKRP